MGPELDPKGRLETIMEVSAGKENVSVVKEPVDQHMRCMSNYEDNTFEIEAAVDEQTELANKCEDMEVNITERVNSGEIALVEAELQDSTENSSSFSGTENGATHSDGEVESGVHGDATSTVPFDGLGEVFRTRKKRLTSHWRTFIRPLMWRCKWVELQIEKFQSQANKYDRELAKYDRMKQLELENSTLEDFDAKSLPFSSQSRRKEFMKRKKRKRDEDTMDTASYMSHHNLFSYYENKRSAADGAAMDDDWGNLVISADKTPSGNDEFNVNDELLCHDFKDGDNFLEQILRKIGTIQSHVSNLKTRVHKVMSENAVKFACNDKSSLLVPCNALTSSAQKPTSPPPNDGDRTPLRSSYIASQLVSTYNMGDLVMPESAVASHGVATNLPGVIESSDQSRVAGSLKNTGDGIIRYKRRAKEELDNSEKNKLQPAQKLQVPKEERESTVPPLPVLEPDLAADDQPTPKIRSIAKLTAPKNKRKRGRRKAGSGKWSRRSSDHGIKVVQFMMQHFVGRSSERA